MVLRGGGDTVVQGHHLHVHGAHPDRREPVQAPASLHRPQPRRLPTGEGEARPLPYPACHHHYCRVWLPCHTLMASEPGLSLALPPASAWPPSLLFYQAGLRSQARLAGDGGNGSSDVVALPPHIFAVADNAYRAMTTSGAGQQVVADQSILVSGESGAGRRDDRALTDAILLPIGGGRCADRREALCRVMAVCRGGVQARRRAPSSSCSTSQVRHIHMRMPLSHMHTYRRGRVLSTRLMPVCADGSMGGCLCVGDHSDQQPAGPGQQAKRAAGRAVAVGRRLPRPHHCQPGR